MKATRYLFTFLVLAMLALTACHNDDLPGGNTLPEGAVHITADIEGVQTRAPQLDADGAGSFEPADEWGMYTFTGDATSPAYFPVGTSKYSTRETSFGLKDCTSRKSTSRPSI